MRRAQLAAQLVERGRAALAHARGDRLLACMRVSVPIVAATTSITTNVMRYCVSETANVRCGGTNQKSNSATLTSDAGGSRPAPERHRDDHDAEQVDHATMFDGSMCPRANDASKRAHRDDRHDARVVRASAPQRGRRRRATRAHVLRLVFAREHVHRRARRCAQHLASRSEPPRTCQRILCRPASDRARGDTCPCGREREPQWRRAAR